MRAVTVGNIGNVMPAETSIVNAIKKALHKLPRCRVMKIHGGAYSIVGTPDITGCIHGRSIFIEVKRHGEDPTPKQCNELDLWLAPGALTGVVRSARDAVEIINGERSWLKDK